MSQKRKPFSKKQKINLVAMIFLSFFSMLAHALPIQSGREYIEVIPPTHLPTLEAVTPKGKVTVVEFFSYACPHCAQLDPVLEKWVNAHQDKIQFYRIPAEWNRGWDNLAKTYYAAEQLKLLPKVHHALFDAMQMRQLNPMDPKQIAALFQEKAGIPEAKFLKAFDSFGVSMAQTRGQQWAIGFGIRGVPAIVVSERYVTDIVKAGSMENLTEVLSTLITMPPKAQ